MIIVQYILLALLQLAWFGLSVAVGYYGSRFIMRKRKEYLAKKARP